MGYRRLLVPLDGSPSAEAVLPAVTAIAKRSNATVFLMHILEEGAPPTIHGEAHLLDAAEAETYIAAVAARLSADGLIVETHVHEAREGDVARSISEHSGQFSPDLVVLCAHGPGGLKAFLAGRVGQQVLQHGDKPILLLQPGPGGQAPAFDLRTVYVPLDDTGRHEGALESAMSIAKLFGAALHLVYVVPTLGTVADERSHSAVLLPNAMRAILDMTQERGNEYLESVAAQCRAEGLAVTSEVLRGSTVGVLLNRAKKVRADLVVLAGHGRAGLSAFLTGSVGARLAGKIDTPLLLVRAREEGSSG